MKSLLMNAISLLGTWFLEKWSRVEEQMCYAILEQFTREVKEIEMGHFLLVTR